MVIGNGNVALDVARILITDPEVLALTDIADHALDTLRPRGVEEVVVIGRRGPLQTAFTTLELRELADLEGVDVIVDPAQLDPISDEDAEAAGKTTKQNIKVLRDYASREPRPGHRRMVFRFLTSPIEIKGEDRVERIVLGRNELLTDESGRVSAKDTGEREELPVQLVVRSVGYRGIPTPGLPFDDTSATIPNTDGRVDGGRNEYVVGWIKRGPTGVIGTNKKDSQDTVDTLIKDLTGAGELADFGHDHAEKVADWLASRQPKLVTSAHWDTINRHERAAGEPHGRPSRQTAEPGEAAPHQPRLTFHSSAPSVNARRGHAGFHHCVVKPFVAAGFTANQPLSNISLSANILDAITASLLGSSGPCDRRISGGLLPSESNLAYPRHSRKSAVPHPMACEFYCIPLTKAA